MHSAPRGQPIRRLSRIVPIVVTMGAIVLSICACRAPVPTDHGPSVELRMASSTRNAEIHVMYDIVFESKPAGTHPSMASTTNASTYLIRYSRSVQVRGCRAPTLRCHGFDYEARITQGEHADLLSRMRKAGARSMGPRLESAGRADEATDDVWSVFLGVGDRTTGLGFRLTPSSAGPRRDVVQAVLGFGNELRERDGSPTHEWEVQGDLVPCQKVSYEELGAHPGRYHGQRVAVEGFCIHRTLHRSSADRGTGFDLLWVSSFADEASELSDALDASGWMRVEGVFRSYGVEHMGSISRITSVERRTTPCGPDDGRTR